MDMNQALRVVRVFESHFGARPHATAWAPGRINLIGEHTDYNDGLVMPAAIQMGIAVAVAPRTDNRMVLFAADPGEPFDAPLSAVRPTAAVRWANYVLGAVAQLQMAGLPVRGFNLAFGGNLPQGAGLSASAALTCSVLLALCRLFNLERTSWQLIQMAQQAEHAFAGVQCGIMDMFSSVFGQREQAMLLDCRSLDYQYVPLSLPGHTLVLLHTGVKHHLADSAYNQRRAECAQGLAWVQEWVPDVQTLRDVTVGMLDQHVAPRDLLVYRRCRFVLEENSRVEASAQALRGADLRRLGQLMHAAHEGLRDDYAVSCAELDCLQSFAASFPGVRGARMMGGGFGGCTLNLVASDAVAAMVDAASIHYAATFGSTPLAITAMASDGAIIVPDNIYATKPI